MIEYPSIYLQLFPIDSLLAYKSWFWEEEIFSLDKGRKIDCDWYFWIWSWGIFGSLKIETSD